MWITTNYKGEEVIWYKENKMDTIEIILLLVKELIVLCLVVIMTIGIVKVNKKLDKIIELSTPEAIQLIVPEKPLLEEK